MGFKLWGGIGLVVFVFIPFLAIYMANPQAEGDGQPGNEPSYAEYVRWLNNDYYGALGVPKDATAADIKKAYRRLSLIHHPDKAKQHKQGDAKPDPARMVHITEAHTVLRSSSTRARYDSFITRLPASARPVYGESRVGTAETVVLVIAFLTVVQYVFMWVRFTERRSAVLGASDLQQVILDTRGTLEGGADMDDTAVLHHILTTLGITEPSLTSLFPVRLLLLPLTLHRSRQARLSTASESLAAERSAEEKAAESLAEREAEKARENARREAKRIAREEAERLEREAAEAAEREYERALEALRERVRERWEKGPGEKPRFDYQRVVSVVTERLFPMMEGESPESMEEQLAESIAARSHPTLLDRLDRAIDAYRAEMSDAAK